MTDPHHVLFPDDPSPLAKWRRDNERREQEMAAERGRDERAAFKSRQVETLCAEVAALRGEIAELHAALAAKANGNDLIEVLNAVREIATERVPDWIKAAVAKSDAVLRGLIAERFGEALGRITAIDPAQARAAKGEASFKFASEKTGDNGDAVELPNPLPPRRAIN